MLQIIVTLLVPSKPRNSACLPYWLSLMPLYLWGTVFFAQPHKVCFWYDDISVIVLFLLGQFKMSLIFNWISRLNPNFVQKWLNICCYFMKHAN